MASVNTVIRIIGSAIGMNKDRLLALLSEKQEGENSDTSSMQGDYYSGLFLHESICQKIFNSNEAKKHLDVNIAEISFV